MKVIPWDGQRITVPGLYRHVPLADYHRGDICDGPSVSSSGLRLLWSKAPKRFWDKSRLNPNRDASDDENESFILGRAAHHLICREPGFSKFFVVRPDKAPDGRDWNGNNKTCKEWLAAQKSNGLTVLTPTQVDNIRGMALALSQTPLVRKGILDGLIEHSMFWKDAETGVWLKARPDVIPTSSGDYADLKTTESAEPEDLQRSLNSYGYVQQGALILEGARALDMEISSFTLVWVEKTRPFCTDVTTIIDEDLERGAKMNRVAIRRFHKCFVEKSWPGPGDREDARYLGLSETARMLIDNRLDFAMREAA